MKATTAKESVEDKIESGVRDIKDTVLKEMQDLKKQIETSRAVRISTVENSAGVQQTEQAHQTIPQSNRTRENNFNRNSANHTGLARSENTKNRDSYVFIAGDSITQILSTKRNTDSSLKGNIKTHSGARIRTIENSVIKMAEDD